MVHSFFEVIGKRPKLMNKTAVRLKSSLKAGANIPKFSEIFSIFFIEENGKFGRNVCSWLDVISSGFEFDEQKVNVIWRHRLKLLFLKLGFKPRKPKNIHVFHFFLYLIHMYRLLINSNYTREDTIFEFFKGFPIEDTTIVMFTNRPAMKTVSSGYAFHLATGPSTKNMLTFLQEEMRLLSKSIQKPKLAVNDLELADVQDECDLTGWIQQGVLLLNMNLTPINGTKPSDAIYGWEIFTDFIITYLNKEFENLVFLLIGAKVADKKLLINTRRHLMVNLYHSAYYSHQSPDPTLYPYEEWEWWLPFINSNFYLYQKLGGVSAPLVDWNSVDECKLGRNKRMQYLISFFKKILEEAKEVLQIENVYRVSKELSVFQNREGYLFFRGFSKNVLSFEPLDKNSVNRKYFY